VLLLSERSRGVSITLASLLVSDYCHSTLGQVHAADGDSRCDHRDGRCRPASKTSRPLPERKMDREKMISDRAAMAFTTSLDEVIAES
jgi:hypothetical protein